MPAIGFTLDLIGSITLSNSERGGFVFVGRSCSQVAALGPDRQFRASLRYARR